MADIIYTRANSYNRGNKSDIFFSNTSTVESKPVKHYNQSDIFCVNVNKENYSTTPVKSQKYKNLHNKSNIVFGAKDDTDIQRNTSKGKVNPRTKSSIHFGDTPSEEFAVKKNKTSGKDYKPDQYYKTESAFQRKLKEFYPEKDYDELASVQPVSTGTLSKEFETKNKRPLDGPDANISAKERKFRQYYNTLTKEEISKHVHEVRDDGESGPAFKDDPKSTKTEFLKSNIFNDPEKKVLYEKYSKEKHSTSNKTEDEAGIAGKDRSPNNQDKIRKNVPKNNWKAKIDWKDANNELIFNKEYEQTDPNFNAHQRMVKNQQDHFSPDKHYTPPSKLEIDDPVSEDKNQIKNCITEVATDELKVKKNMELSSVLQGSDFYKSAVKYGNTPNRQVSNFEIKIIKDFESLRVKDIEAMFKTKGIHIYDIKSSGSYINGNTNGHLSFKIREGTDDSFKSNLSDIKRKLKTDMGLEIQPQIQVTRKPNTDTLPSNLKWDNVKAQNITKNKKEFFVKSNENDNKPPVYEKEKISKSFAHVNHSFKNNSGMTKFKKK